MAENLKKLKLPLYVHNIEIIHAHFSKNFKYTILYYEVVFNQLEIGPKMFSECLTIHLYTM